ncbi:MAG: hypothetical protein ACHQ5A_01875 [Opitutales bacterium]
MIVLSWASEFLGIPHHLFGEPAGIVWSRAIARTLIMIAIWIWVHWTTKRLLQRLHYLEEFLLVCGWCRKVGHQGQWLTMEEYFSSKFATETSHGICPECIEKMRLIPPVESES